MRCRVCGYKVVYPERRFCKKHLVNYVEKKFLHYIEKYRIFNKKVLIAISGGKDSVVLSYLLNKFKEKYNLNLTLIFIDLDIPNFSRESFDVVIKVNELLNLPFIVEKAPSVKKIKEKIGKKPCSFCGVIKRYLINKVAFENNFDFIALGHNLDDALFFSLKNLKNRDIDYFLRENEISFSEKRLKLIGKIKPLYYLTDREIKLFADIKQLPYVKESCPFSDNLQSKEKEKIDEIFNVDEKVLFVKSLRDLKSLISNNVKSGSSNFVKIDISNNNRVNNHLIANNVFIKNDNDIENKNVKEVEEGKVNFCKVCGFPTSKGRDVCRFCKIKEMLEE